MEIKYENKIVAFIDVLGFSNLVYTDDLDPINNYFSFVIDDFSKAAFRKEIEFLLISDSIVVISENSKAAFQTLVKVICSLQEKLIDQCGILLRGGISFGDVYFDKINNIIVGKGLINAHKLESHAIYPRIIIDRRFLEIWKGTDAILEQNKLLRFFPPEPYCSDYPYIDYAKKITYNTQKHKYTNVIKFLSSNYYGNDYIVKYEWLIVHLKEASKNSISYLKEKENKTRNEKMKLKCNLEFQDNLYIL